MHILPPYADDTRAVRALTRVAQRLIPRTESTTEDGGDATYVFAATHVAHVIHILQVLSGTLACFDASIVEEDATLDWDVLLPACLRHNDNEEPQGAAWPSTICAAVHTVNERHKDASAATRLHCVALRLQMTTLAGLARRLCEHLAARQYAHLRAQLLTLAGTPEYSTLHAYPGAAAHGSDDHQTEVVLAMSSPTTTAAARNPFGATEKDVRDEALTDDVPVARAYHVRVFAGPLWSLVPESQQAYIGVLRDIRDRDGDDVAAAVQAAAEAAAATTYAQLLPAGSHGDGERDANHVALLRLSYLLDDFRAFVHPEELMEKLDASMGKPMTASGEPLAE